MRTRIIVINKHEAITLRDFCLKHGLSLNTAIYRWKMLFGARTSVSESNAINLLHRDSQKG